LRGITGDKHDTLSIRGCIEGFSKLSYKRSSIANNNNPEMFFCVLEALNQFNILIGTFGKTTPVSPSNGHYKSKLDCKICLVF
jgi:hypothetical protein